jgi:DNA-binding NarL/FixJ family response regulator
MTVRIAVLDEELLFVEGLRSLLASEPEIEVARVSSGSALSDAVGPGPEDAQVDVVVVDPRSGGGGSFLAELKERFGGANILVLSMVTSPDRVHAALHGGADGYALKDQPLDEVLDAIRRVAAGERYLAPKLPRELLEPGGAGTALERLSPREKEIFELVVQGHSTQKISEELSISVKTVETHRAHINRKIGAHSAADLIRYAVQHELIS